MKDIELKLICELLKNCRRSDRELAKVLKASQPTVSRTIKKLEKEGVIQEYTIIPNMEKLDIEMISITVAAFKLPPNPEERMCVCTEFVKNHPNIILLSSGRGTLANTERVFISIHKNYSDYAKFIKEVKAEITEYQIVDSFLISYKGDKILKQLAFSSISEYLKRR